VAAFVPAAGPFLETIINVFWRGLVPRLTLVCSWPHRALPLVSRHGNSYRLGQTDGHRLTSVAWAVTVKQLRA